jgi:hypothetical protein
MKKLQVMQDLATAVNELKQEMSMKRGKEVLMKPPKGGELSEGYSVSFANKKMIVGYHAHIRLNELNTKKFEGEIDENISSFISDLKKKYKEITGKSIRLKKSSDEFDKEIFAVSLKRAWVVARAIYEIPSASDEDDEDDED